MHKFLSQKDISLWLGSEASYNHVADCYAKAMAMITAGTGNGMDEDEDGPESPILTISDGIGIIDIHGSLIAKSSWWSRIFEITSYDDIRNAIVEAVESPDVRRIMLDVDSSGGEAKGTGELADFIREASKYKKITTYVSGTAFSAAYWIPSASNKIVGHKMAEAGSIGVIAVLAEYTEMYKEAGIKVHVFRGGKYKALGNPYEKLSKDGERIIQEKIDTMEEFFLDAVADFRRLDRDTAKESVGEGRTFFAQEAVDNGLMDGIISYDKLYTAMVKSISADSDTNRTLLEELDMKKKVLTEQAIAAKAAGASKEEIEALMAEEEVDEGGEASDESGTEPESQAEEPASEEEVDEGEESEGGESEGGESDTSATDAGLISYLKDENKELRAQVDELKGAAAAGADAQANESELKKVVSEYIGQMCIALGISPMNMSSMSSNMLLTQYADIRRQYTSEFTVGSSANVQDKDDTDSKGEGVSHIQRAAAKANEI
ncbi:MAG: S49 family peptidase [Candidatus Bathyarchaeota archaeon]|jgi:signal peptide peptidase SppA